MHEVHALGTKGISRAVKFCSSSGSHGNNIGNEVVLESTEIFSPGLYRASLIARSIGDKLTVFISSENNYGDGGYRDGHDTYCHHGLAPQVTGFAGMMD